METNASWVRGREHAEEVLSRLAGAGLRMVLVSLSPFHAEFIPLARTTALIDAARATLPGGAFVWIPQFMEDLAGEDPERRLDLEATLAERGDGFALGLAGRYGLTPAGRAGRFIHRHGRRLPWWEAARSARCRQRLSSTSHFHVDLEGLFVPGLCAGITLPLDQVPGDLDAARFPLVAALASGGPAELVALARDHGFAPHETYGSACDLCTHCRIHLAASGDYEELGPAGFYDRRSVSFDM